MKVSDKRVGFRRAVTMLVVVAGFAAEGLAYQMPNPEVEVDGVRYMLDYYSADLRYYQDASLPSDIPWDQKYCLNYHTMLQMIDVQEICMARIYYDNESQNCKFSFYDGSEIPGFQYITRVISSNSPSPKEHLPRYDAEKDEMRKRYPYYTGEVWLQDSVLMPDMPDLRKKKKHIVCDFRGIKFNDELTFIRTPRYAVVPWEAFKNCAGLKTARIGAVQKVKDCAFENCTNLETVIFERLPLLLGSPFKNCPNIRTVVIEGSWIDDSEWYYYYSICDCFDDEVYKNATLYVRGNQITNFRLHTLWGKFKNIRTLEEYVSGVEVIGADSAVEYRVYNLSGVLVRTAKSGQDWREDLPAGVYVVKSSLGNVRKEYVK